ncbi:MAG TPA: hypothetical protein VFH61_05860 [Thermoleophilia bacterium]|nr:hypothetical protein [Thermoleophilia bacterium]
MSFPRYPGVAGIGTARSTTPARVLCSEQGAVLYPRGHIIDGDNARDPGNTSDVDVLRAGTLLGKITASGLLGASVIGLTAAAYTSGATSLTLSAAAATEVSRRFGTSGTGEIKIVGAPTAAGTVAETDITHSAVNTTTGVLTISDLGANFVSGSMILAADGCENIVGIVGDGYGIKVTDADDDDIDVPIANLVVGGIIDDSQIVDMPVSTNTTLVTWLKAEIRANGMGYVFESDF